VPGHIRADLDGRPIPAFRLNHAFTGIAIPDAGTHHISIRREPPHLRIALALSAGGLGLLLVSSAALWAFRCRRQSPTKG